MPNDGKRNLLRSPSVQIGGAAFLLGVTGVLTIASSRYALAYPDTLLAKQALFLVIGMAVMFSVAAIPFRGYVKHAPALGAAGLLLLLILPLGGVRVHGMMGWLRFGGVSLQPSELMKAPFLLMLAVILSKCDRSELRRFGFGMLWMTLWIVPVALQPDFGTAAIYFGVFVLLYFAIGGRIAYLAVPLVAGAAAAAWFVYRHQYAWKRLCGFVDPWSDPLGNGWHSLQFDVAIARGGLFGVKLGGAIWSNNYLPFPYNDSAFATLSETLGFTGGVLVCGALVLLALSLWRLGRSGLLPRTNRVFIIGVMVLLTLQSMVHVSVNLRLLPTTGLTMPFVSYGGSSLIGCFWLLGMALSAGSELEKPPVPVTDNNAEDVQ